MKRSAAILAVTALLSMLIMYSGQAADSCREGLRLCFTVLIPSLYPFFVLSCAISRLGLPTKLGSLLAPAAGRLYGISGAGASALAVGLLGGYPGGAAYIAEMRRSGVITVSEGERLIAFCNNSGPGFIIGAVGCGIFHSARVGVMIYMCHVTAACICGLFFRSSGGGHGYEQPCFIDTAAPDTVLPDCIRQATENILTVCGFAVFFTTVAGLLDAGGLLSGLCGRMAEYTGAELHFVRAVLTGLLELGSGVGVMRGMSLTPPSVALAAFLTGFGGLSVYFQTKAILHGSNIKGALHFAGRLTVASLSALLAGTATAVLL